MKSYSFYILLILALGCTHNKDVTNHSSVDSSLINEQMALDKAIFDVDTAKIIELAKKGVNLNQRDSKGLYPLYKAKKTIYYNPENSFLTRTLIELGAKDLNDSLTVFFALCEKGNYDSVKFLINNGYNVNSKRFWYDPEEEDEGCDCYETPISTAVKSGNIELVKLLIINGAKINFDEEGVHPLSIAIQYKQYQIAELLLKYGADKNSFFILDNNYYDYAQEDTVLIDFLVKNNFPLGKHNGPSALTKAANDNNLWLVKKLSSIATQEEIDKALCMANDIEMAEFLLDNGANVNFEFAYDMAESCFSTIPITNAVLSNNLEYVKFLVEKGAEINSLDSYMENYNTYCPRISPLLQATIQNNYEIASYLVSLGANVNYIQKISYDSYTSPLIEAVSNNNFEIVKLLLSNNAKIENRGVSIFNYTKDSTDKRILELLDKKR